MSKEYNEECGCNDKYENNDCDCEHDDCDCEHDDCGCGHDHHHEVEKIFLTLDDGKELECVVLAYFEVKGKDYVALLSEEDERVLLYEYEETEDGLALNNIEDEDEFEMVSEAYMEIFDDYDEDYDQEEDE